MRILILALLLLTGCVAPPDAANVKVRTSTTGSGASMVYYIGRPVDLDAFFAANPEIRRPRPARPYPSFYYSSDYSPRYPAGVTPPRNRDHYGRYTGTLRSRHGR